MSIIREYIKEQGKRLRFYSIDKFIEDVTITDDELSIIHKLFKYEEDNRNIKYVNTCIKRSKTGVFEVLAEFDWTWPIKINRELIQELFTYKFVEDKVNIVFLGPNGIGKTMIAKNLVHEAAKRGISALFIDSFKMLHDILGYQNRELLEKEIKKYVIPKLLVIDEVGSLSYSSRDADIFYQIISRRNSVSTVITTSRVFSEWPLIFPNSSSVAALVDRFTERCELVTIEGKSYRQKKYQDRINTRQDRQKDKI